MARKIGFIGKTCIHPGQIEPVNQIFGPSQHEIDFALPVLAAVRDTKNMNLGAFLLEGRMIDRPFIQRSRRIADLAQKMGALSL